MSNALKPGRLLVGRKEITEYLRIGDPLFYELIKIGLPARVINRRWFAHADNLDLFFKQITMKGCGEIHDDAE